MITKKFIVDNFKGLDNLIEIDNGFKFDCNYNEVRIEKSINGNILICTHEFSTREGDSVEVYSEKEVLEYFSNRDSSRFLK